MSARAAAFSQRSVGFTSDTPSLHHDLMTSRRLSQTLAQPLSDEDQCVQAMDDASPTKWHLAHTTWFYEAFVLRNHLSGYRPFSPAFDFCFNSYYETQGARHPRARRGLLTRPTAREVRDYRAHVDDALNRLCTQSQPAPGSNLHDLLTLGINHEQQHQELLLTDILALFASNPLKPAYRTRPRSARPDSAASEAREVAHAGGIVDIGHEGAGFAYDNEGPRHRALLHPFAIADRCVTNGEWLAFMADEGYRNPLLWLADGWATVNQECWTAPGYWEEVDGAWHQMTLDGLLPVDPAAPVSHVSYYEADAFARWAGKRLPTEFEWEAVAAGVPATGNTLGSDALRPLPAPSGPSPGLKQLFGDVWEWTQSAYQPYPGYRPSPGAVGEYNGKFMCNQQVLKGASCTTVDGHSRATYRNFFYPRQRWQFTGVRLAAHTR
jgi:ergothioneine biosynthesis protein EgtB